jgi:hypothetical protein
VRARHASLELIRAVTRRLAVSLLVKKNRNGRFDPTARERADEIAWGAQAGGTYGAGFFCWVATIDMVSGPGIFERVGVSWLQIGMAYIAVGLATGSAFGALQRMRHHVLVAMLQWSLMFLLPIFAVPTNMGLSLGRVPSLPGDLWLALIASAVVGGLTGWWMWREDRRASTPTRS